MLSVYLVGIPTYHESDEVTVKYVVYNENNEKLKRDTRYTSYKKPVLVGMYALMMLLKEIKEYEKEDITVYVNDGALVEQVQRTTTTKNRDVLKVAELTRKHIRKFNPKLKLHSVAGNFEEMKDWEAKLS